MVGIYSAALAVAFDSVPTVPPVDVHIARRKKLRSSSQRLYRINRRKLLYSLARFTKKPGRVCGVRWLAFYVASGQNQYI